MENAKLVRSLKWKFFRAAPFVIIENLRQTFEIFHVSSVGKFMKSLTFFVLCFFKAVKFSYVIPPAIFFSLSSFSRQMFFFLCSPEWIIAIPFSELYQSQVSSIENFSHLITAVIFRETWNFLKRVQTINQSRFHILGS